MLSVTVTPVGSMCDSQSAVSGSRAPKWILKASSAVVQFRARVHCGTGVGDSEVDQLAGGVLVGEVAFVLIACAAGGCAPRSRWYPWCRSHDGPRGERQERDHVLPGVQPGLGDDREPFSPGLVEALELGLGGGGVDGRVDRLELAGDPLALAPRDVLQPAATEMDTACLDAQYGRFAADPRQQERRTRPPIRRGPCCSPARDAPALASRHFSSSEAVTRRGLSWHLITGRPPRPRRQPSSPGLVHRRT
jgi:hypothetical protein